MNKDTHNCENNIESNMTPAHCRACGKELKTDTQNWKEEFERKMIPPDIKNSSRNSPMVWMFRGYVDAKKEAIFLLEKTLNKEREEMIGVVGEKIDTTGIEYAEEPMDDESRAKKITAIVKNAIISNIITKLKERK